MLKIYDQILDLSNSSMIDNDLKNLAMFASQFQFIAIMGLPKTGKTCLANLLLPRLRDIKWFGHLSRANMIQDTFGPIEITDSIHSVYNAYFKGVLHNAYANGSNVGMVFEGELLTQGYRGSLVKQVRQSGMRSLVLVCDGPPELIKARVAGSSQNSLGGMSEMLDLNTKFSKIVYPTLKEGWTKILYVNTFGDEGNDYLLETCTERGSI